jgi:hypothetical protein
MATPTSHDVDAVIERATMVSDRVRARMAAPAMSGLRRSARRAKRFALIGMGGAALVLVTALIVGIFVPLGVPGIMLTMLAMMGVMCAAILFSREADVPASAIAQASLPQLADRTTAWIDQNRRALPAPAATLADHIGQRIAGLAPQLATLAPNSGEAVELRRLVGEELPQLVEGYRRVPANLRRTDRNGRVAERDLIEGMRLLDTEITTLTTSIASADMDRLSSQRRYLELRYQGDETAG